MSDNQKHERYSEAYNKAYENLFKQLTLNMDNRNFFSRAINIPIENITTKNDLTLNCLMDLCESHKFKAFIKLVPK